VDNQGVREDEVQTECNLDGVSDPRLGWKLICDQRRDQVFWSKREQPELSKKDIKDANKCHCCYQNSFVDVFALGHLHHWQNDANTFEGVNTEPNRVKPKRWVDELNACRR